MIVVTGASGFIGSYLVAALNAANFKDIIAVDDFSASPRNASKLANLEGKTIRQRVDRMAFFDWLAQNHSAVEFIFHLGARTDTTEFDQAIFDTLNLHYSQQIWQDCCRYQIPLVYASSAATYGNGELGYDDNEQIISQLQPLNPYGRSKNDFDIWALAQAEKPLFWAGLKFFNVYGPNEYHKGRMASVVFHAYQQIKKTGSMRLFRSHNPEFKDGEQSRDFVYVKDVASVMMFLMQHRQNSGLYNLGSGQARTFLDLTRSTFKAMGVAEDIGFIDTPEDIRDKYQYFTQANMEKLKNIGYNTPFHTLEEGVTDYVQQYLMTERFH
ncbi:ADP-glyceromanno-heptose 6-epimerase [Eisenibacter elegans]|jgi:ADP-L-glycero-D-manno-heptose 6-epimerase|uniref:ADP-glyceromanno-heptose 6-epimerase n=1 Tax=Eisenibacter elegans TaxID=997 RepID=UPI00040DCCBC|nr:ADP-glyceromanno-heptose 6-epimerase [Eisenibacter elegans]